MRLPGIGLNFSSLGALAKAEHPKLMNTLNQYRLQHKQDDPFHSQ
jgi:hypothetical protein